MWDKITQVWKIKDVRNNILFVLGMLTIFRLVAHIPIPGVNLENLRYFFESNQVLGMLNLFSGGTMENFSIVMLGVAPYITSSIIFQLLAMIVPKLEEMTKEGESGQQKINMYTRYLAVPLAFLQSFGMIKLLNNSSRPILGDISGFQIFIIMLTITAGTMFLVWIGELITEKKVGNGISLLIFAGIVSSIATVVGVVFISEGQRNIPVNYAKQVRGNRVYGGSSTHLPLRVNMAGVIPIIFAISLVMFPPMVAQFFTGSASPWLPQLAA